MIAGLQVRVAPTNPALASIEGIVIRPGTPVGKAPGLPNVLVTLQPGNLAIPAIAQTGTCVIDRAKNGAMVKIRGVVYAGRHDIFIRPEHCPDNRVIVIYGDDPELGRAGLVVKRDDSFREFQKYLREPLPSKPSANCQQCRRYQVTAELSGRLDIASSVGVKRDSKTGKVIGLEGYGHPLPFTRYRLVMTAVSNVEAVELPVSAVPET